MSCRFKRLELPFQPIADDDRFRPGSLVNGPELEVPPFLHMAAVWPIRHTGRKLFTRRVQPCRPLLQQARSALWAARNVSRPPALSGATWKQKHMSSDCDVWGLVRKLLTCTVHSCRGKVQQPKIAFTDVLALCLVVVRSVVQILEPPLNFPACLGYPLEALATRVPDPASD